MAKSRSPSTRVRKPMPRKPPKVEVPKTVYRRRPKHRAAGGGRSDAGRDRRRAVHRPLPRDQPQARQPPALPPPAPARISLRAIGDLGPVRAWSSSRAHRARASIGHPDAGRSAPSGSRVSRAWPTSRWPSRTGVTLRGAARPRWSSAIDGPSFDSFRITARRAFKTFPLTSRRVNRAPGRPRARAAARRAREPRASRAERPRRGAARTRPSSTAIRRPAPGGLPVGSGGDGGGAALRRHRLAGGARGG